MDRNAREVEHKVNVDCVFAGFVDLYASKISSFCLLMHQLCTYTANSLCFSSEAVACQVCMMDSLMAGTAR